MRPFRPVSPRLPRRSSWHGPLRASDALPEPTGGRSATVTQPHVTAELIAETTARRPASPSTSRCISTWIAAGTPTGSIPATRAWPPTIKWTLPPGMDSRAHPVAHARMHAMGPLTTYGYGGDVYLLTQHHADLGADG